MASNNHGVRIRNAVAAGAQIAAWDFTRRHFTISTRAGEASYVPDLHEIEASECTTTGEYLKARIEHFDGEVAVYDFGNGCVGLCLEDEREHHYFVPVAREESNIPALTNEGIKDTGF